MAQPTLEQAFQTALQHHQAGRIPQAEQGYRQILAGQPGYAPALLFLGVIAHEVGRNDAAEDLLRQAVARAPNAPEAHYNLGVVLKAKGQLDDAIAAYRQAISLRPNLAEAHNSLGTALRDRGQLDHAANAFRTAIALKPDYAQANNNLGNVLREKGKLDEAIAAYRKAISVKPDYAEAHGNLGSALRDQGRLHEAIAAHRQAVALKPNYADGHFHLGNSLRETGQLDEAIAAYRQAILLRPGYADAYVNLGIALKSSGRLDEAAEAYSQAIARKSDHADAYYNLANTLYEQGKTDEAIAAYKQAIAIKPKYPQAYSNLANVLRQKGQLDEAIAAYRHAIAMKPDYAEALYNLGNGLREKGQPDDAIIAYHQSIAANPNDPEAYSNLGNALKDVGQLDEAIAAYRQALTLMPTKTVAHDNLCMVLHYHPAYDAKAIAEEHRLWNERHAQRVRHLIKPVIADRNSGRRLRIGYVSPDLWNHPVGRFLLPLLEQHDKREFETFAYASVARPDEMTQRLQASVEVWRNIKGLTDDQAADLIRQDRIDILVDLAMHSADNRLLIFARKPAPVQVRYLAYCSTTGMPSIDYRLSDPYLDPPGGDESIYTERTIRLPETYWCYQQTLAIPEPGPLPAVSGGSMTFGCLNNFCKITEPTIAAWARILQTVPNSQLLLFAPQGAHRQRLQERFERDGIASTRVRFSGPVPIQQYFDVYRQIDIALDPFPFGGGTTTCDALYMGVPIVTLAGKTAVGRAGLSILSNLDLTEWVAHSTEDYVHLAVELAGDISRLSDLRATLRRRMEQSPLMDAPRFARNVEAAYREMWKNA